MVFKKRQKSKFNYRDIETLFRDLNSKGIVSPYGYQSEVFKSYENAAMDEANVAIELPTGSGKTLIGILIAEFRRRNNQERILYLCPTIQLVNQAVNLANTSYGVNASAFTGGKYEYDQTDKAKYINRQTIAVAPYSALFNSNPYFKDADVIILDDAHAAESYIASNWTLRVSRHDHENVYKSIIEIMKSYVDDGTYNKLMDDGIDPMQKRVVNLLASYDFQDMMGAFQPLMDASLENINSLKYPYSLLRDHLDACHLYYNWNEILIRPVIPPSMTNVGFAHAKQRIFMSATLGSGGDLERITGISKFHKIPLPAGWEKQGLGRRFITFPNLSLDEDEALDLVMNLIDSEERSVVLVSSYPDAAEFESILADDLPETEVFSAKDIENSKEKFVNSKNAVALIANRFDGMDFPGKEANLLIIKDIPYTANLQESFLQSRVSASIIFYDRNRTRLVQALGRCTRSATDYAAVVVLGERGLAEWLLYPDKRQYFHPELQAELEFGFGNSQEMSIEEFKENFNNFIAQKEEWEDCHNEIIELRNETEKVEIPGEKKLEATVCKEVEYQYHLWEGKFEQAAILADEIFNGLDGGSELTGYRAFWQYLVGCAHFLHYQNSNNLLAKELATNYFDKAYRISSAFPFLKSFEGVESEPEKDVLLENNLDQLTDYVQEQKIVSPKKFIRNVEEVLEGLVKDGGDFEKAHEQVGRYLGFATGNSDASGAPDPFWIISSEMVIVFEDKIHKSDDKILSLREVRQACLHKDWIKANINNISKEATIITVVVTNSTSVDQAAIHLCPQLHYWNYHQFGAWASSVLAFMKILPTKYSGAETKHWKEYLEREFSSRELTAEKIIKKLKPLSELLTVT